MRRGGYRPRRRRVQRMTCARVGSARAPGALRGLKPRPAVPAGRRARNPVLASTNQARFRKKRAMTGVGAMSRSIMMLRVTVKDGERALLTRNGRLERLLDPGRHRLFDPARELGVEVFAIVRAEFPADRYAVLKAARPDLASTLFEAVACGRKLRWLAGASRRSVDHARVLEGRDPDRRRAHRRGRRASGRAAPPQD